MPKANFFIIGAGRSGTTTIYYWLKQHPEIYMSPVKEPSFFAFEGKDRRSYGPNVGLPPRNIISDSKDYWALFDGVKKEKVIGEASVVYLMKEEIAERIKRYAPKAKLIAILRNPVDRQYSRFLGHVQDGSETRSFEEMVQAEKGSAIALGKKQKGYLGRGFYYDRLKHYFEIFGQAQMRVYLYEDLENKPLELMQDICRFLGVDDSFVPSMSVRHAKTGAPKNKALHGLLKETFKFKKTVSKHMPFVFPYLRRVAIRIKNKNLTKPSIPKETRKQLIEIYREDILKLQELIKRDLSKWLGGSRGSLRAKERRIPICYVVGSGRSGSTLLGMLLDTHPDLMTVGEIINIGNWLKYDDVCSCGQPISNCQIWKGLKGSISTFMQQQAAEGLPSKPRAFLPWLKLSRREVESARFDAEVFSVAREASRKKLLVDISKSPYRLLELERSGLFDIKVIHLVRDGRGCLHSYLKPTKVPIKRIKRKIKKRGKRPLRFLFRWASSNIFSWWLGLTHFRKKYVRIRYEDICSNPQQALDFLFQFLGQRPASGCFKQIADAKHHLIGGNRMRFSNLEQITLDDQWKTKSPTKYKIIFALFAGWVNLLIRTKKPWL